METIVQSVLMFFLLPMWVAAGFADWLCHRRADIEHTAGLKESLIHVLMFMEVGLPLLAALFLEVNALLLGLMVLAFLLHEATALWDVSYAVSRRTVTPWEQHVHSFLEMIPLMAIVLLLVRHFDRLVEADFSLSLKSFPLPIWYMGALACAIMLLTVVPYANELSRCIAARRQQPGKPQAAHHPGSS